MKKSTKILIGAAAATVVVCVLIVVVASLRGKNPDFTPTTEPVTDPGTTYFDLDPANTPDIPTNPTTTAAPTTVDLSAAIIGKWMDSANMSGYEFFKDGTVAVTYVNLTIPFINLPINGTANGTYTINGNEVTMKYSIYTKTIIKHFFASINGNELSLRDVDENDTATYRRMNGNETIPTAAPQTSDDLTGTWVNSDATMRFVFNDDATVNITFVGYKDTSASRKGRHGDST